MPWHIVADHAECGQGQYAVVKDSDGSVEACHATRTQAQKHMAALYANEPGAGRDTMGEVEDRAAVDNSEWDGNAAMSACGGAACYRAICAGRKSGPAEERGSWALPHHKRPGSPPNAAGVRNALSRLPQTQGLTNAEAARRHLEAHIRAIQAQSGRSYGEVDGMAVTAAVAERRITAVAVEARAGKESQRTIGGYAAMFNKTSRNLGGFIERIAPGAFNKSRGDGWPDVLARYNHDDNMLLGTTAGRTLRLQIDELGLFYEVDLPQARGDVYELVTRGDVQKSSFAFRVAPDADGAAGDRWGVSEDEGYPMRELRALQLVDVAPVNIPAYIDSSVSPRGLVDPTVALRSLADQVEAELDEVRAAAQANELHRYLVNTGSTQPMPKPAKRRLSGAAALARIREREIT